MLWVIVAVCQAETVSVGDNNFDNIMRKGKPVLLELWNPYCPHCRAFRPIWERLADQSTFREHVIFADSNCIENRKFCKKFAIDGYPSLVYVDGKRENSVYLGIMSFNSIEAFLEKRLSTIMFVESETELENNLRKTNMTAVFLMEYVNKKDKRFESFQEAAREARNIDSVFLARESNTTKLTVFASPRHSTTYTGNWTRESIGEFVMEHRFSKLPPLTPALFDHFSWRNEFIFLVFLSHSCYDSVLSMSEDLSLPYRLFYETCGPDSHLSQYMSVNCRKLPQFALVDLNRTRWSFAPGNDLESLTGWVDNIKQNSVKWRGPGTFYFASFWAKVWTIKTTGGFAWLLFIACLCLVIVLCSLMAYDCCKVSPFSKKREGDGRSGGSLGVDLDEDGPEEEAWLSIEPQGGE